MKKLPTLRFKGKESDAYRGNSYVLKCLRASTLIYSITWALNELHIFIVDQTIMNTGIVCALLLCLIAHAYAYISPIDTQVSCYVILFFMVAFASLCVLVLSYHTILFMLFPMICSMQYFDKRITYYTYALSCIGLALAVLVGFRIGLCDANMLLLTYTNTEFHKQALLSGSFTLNDNTSLLFLYFVFPRWLLFATAIPMQNHVSNEIQEWAGREARAKHLAETDGLTGLFNRNKYLEMLVSYYRKRPTVGVFYFDINNLKTINDSLGHEFGDLLIVGLAEELWAFSSNICKAYRVGGDEFVMICESGEAECKLMFAELERRIQGKQVGGGVILYSAIGSAYGPGSEVELLVNRADSEMYLRKLQMKKERAAK